MVAQTQAQPQTWTWTWTWWLLHDNAMESILVRDITDLKSTDLVVELLQDVDLATFDNLVATGDALDRGDNHSSTAGSNLAQGRDFRPFNRTHFNLETHILSQGLQHLSTKKRAAT